MYVMAENFKNKTIKTSLDFNCKAFLWPSIVK